MKTVKLGAIFATIVIGAIGTTVWAHGNKSATFGFEALDADQNGSISQTELMVPFQDRFAKVDSDGNGEISLEEWQNHKPNHHKRRGRGFGGHGNHENWAEFALDKFDTDGNGQLNQEELENAFAK